MLVIFATYIHNVTTLPCKIANNDKVIIRTLAYVEN